MKTIPVAVVLLLLEGVHASGAADFRGRRDLKEGCVKSPSRILKYNWIDAGGDTVSCQAVECRIGAYVADATTAEACGAACSTFFTRSGTAVASVA